MRKDDVSPSLYAFDQNQTRRFGGLIAGVDEAGRGPLAGPVVAAAVILIRQKPIAFLNDSKQLSPRWRSRLFLEIARDALVGIGTVGEKQIDNLNIYQATRLAMKKAVLALSRTPDAVLVDGNMRLDLPVVQAFFIAGDARSAAIAAASIIAKVHRDALMEEFDKIYPQYDFKQHKGYATPKHLEKIRRFGPCPLHRTTFSPISLSAEVLG